MILGWRHRFAIRLTAVCLVSVACAFASRGKSRSSPASHSSTRKAAAASADTTSGRVADIRFWSLGDATRIAVEVTSSYKLKSDRLQNPDRLFFDVQGVRPSTPKRIQTITVGDSLVKQLRVAETTPGTTRIVLDLAGAVEYTASQLTSPERLIIEVRAAGSAPRPVTAPVTVAPETEKSPSGPRKFQPPVHARIVLPPARIDLVPPRLTARVDSPSIPTERISVGPPPAPEIPRATARVIPTRDPVATLPESVTRAGPRTHGNSSAAPTTPAAVEIPRETARAIPTRDSTLRDSTPMPVATPPESVMRTRTRTPVNSAATPARTPSGGEASLTRVLGLKLGRVVIDAGHGGHDAGTSGPGGLLEKDLVLDVAKRLAVLVETRLGSDVLLTRSDDTFIPLEQRPRIANENKADLFISIHANSSPVRTVSGVETYYLNFTTSRTALEVAARENATSEHSIADLRDLLQKIAMKDKLEESREFAAKVQTSLAVFSTRNPGTKDRGVKKAPFVVLIGASMPAVLAEIGFVTNSRDEQMMKRPEYRQKVADALYRGISQYASGLSHFQVAQRKPAGE